MASSFAIRSLTLVALAAALAGCGRDVSVSEQVMEAKQAAERAEAAQRAAEAAASRLTRQTSPEVSVIEENPENYERDDPVEPDVVPEPTDTDSGSNS